jgi:diguanylate cyclase (GGDEF)-like protein
MIRPLLESNRADEAESIFKREQQRIYRRTDRLISIIMSLQWPGAVAASLILSPRTWDGAQSSIHPHFFAAVYLGGLITVFPVLLAILQPGRRSTRHTIAACQMLMSGLLIHISGGRIETHFHVFGSLAFLAFYLDWTVILTATVVTLIDHVAMSYIAPVSIFGTAIASNGRLLEHILWVVFCDGGLIVSCIQSLKGLRMAASREADQDLLLHQAYHDALTGLGNRLLIQQTMSDRLVGAPEKPGGFVLMAIDLDRFKEVNDNLGHQTGDQVLIEVSERLRTEIRAKDTLVRMGGDEFSLILDDCPSLDVAEKIAGRIIESINRPFLCGTHTIHLGASIGLCLCDEAGSEVADIFRHADLALYQAKKNGRNHLVVFDEAMRAETLYQMSLEHRLRAAILEESMELHYQPIVDHEGETLGFEALLRWNDPKHGSVSPAEFVPLAERSGLILPLGLWVLRKACQQAAEWHRAGRKLTKMSVNISPIQLMHREFVPNVLAVLTQTGLPPELLDLELTESTLIENDVDTQEALKLLRKIGVRLSIDDFGTGYSSLSYLRDLPVHTLKIDRSFVRDIVSSSEARRLVEGMIEMAHSLRLRVVAEGVETREQMNMLVCAGCDEIQGYHISKAVSADAANRFLAENEASRQLSREACDRPAQLLESLAT